MAHDFKKFPELRNSQMQLYYFDSPHVQITQSFQAKVIEVHDGDTIRVSTSFRDFDFPIRLAFIAAPELNEEGGAESQSFLEELVLGKEVWIDIDPNNRVGKWGRIIGDVKIDGISASEISKLMGFSVPFGNATQFWNSSFNFSTNV